MPTLDGALEPVQPLHGGPPLFVIPHGSNAQLLEKLPQFVVDTGALGGALTARLAVGSRSN